MHSGGGVVLAAACAAGGQVRIITGQRGPDGTIVRIGTIEPDPEKERLQLQAVCGEKTAAAQAAMAKGLWTAALGELDEAQRYSPTPAQLQTIRGLYETIEAEAKSRLEAADALMKEGQYEEGLAAYESIGRTFGMLPSAGRARQRLAQARNDPEIRQAVQEARAVCR
ncbi:MAG: hypothetical protein NTV86_13385 [Planctomycetota bacterium]|nr:hypothetical protein [Planctomycetota bacterium]